jgi:prophage DNA circulation protein
MADFYFKAAFGRLSLLVTELDSVGGRDLVIHSPARGDDHVVQDRGRTLRRTRAEVLFVDQPGLEPALDRFRAFLAAVNRGEPDIFCHPIDGSYLAAVEEFRYTVSADQREVHVECSFVGVEEPEVVLSPGAGVSSASGPEEVGVTVANVATSLETQGLTSDVPGDCLARVTAWAQADDPDTRAVYLEVSSLSSRIATEVERLELASDLSRWELYRQFTMLQYQVQRAAEAVASEAERVFDLTLRASVPLRVLCARVYGAAEAEDRQRQVLRLNPLRSPGLVPSGTTLKMPAVGGRRG